MFADSCCKRLTKSRRWRAIVQAIFVVSPERLRPTDVLLRLVCSRRETKRALRPTFCLLVSALWNAGFAKCPNMITCTAEADTRWVNRATTVSIRCPNAQRRGQLAYATPTCRRCTGEWCPRFGGHTQPDEPIGHSPECCTLDDTNSIAASTNSIWNVHFSVELFIGEIEGISKRLLVYFEVPIFVVSVHIFHILRQPLRFLHGHFRDVIIDRRWQLIEVRIGLLIVEFLFRLKRVELRCQGEKNVKIIDWESSHVRWGHRHCCAGGTTDTAAAVVSKSFALPSLRRCLSVGNLSNNYAPYWHNMQIPYDRAAQWFNRFVFSPFVSYQFRTLYSLQFLFTFIYRNQNKRAMQFKYTHARFSIVCCSSPLPCLALALFLYHIYRTAIFHNNLSKCVVLPFTIPSIDTNNYLVFIYSVQSPSMQTQARNVTRNLSKLLGKEKWNRRCV